MTDEDLIAARVWSDRQTDYLQAWIDAGKPQTMHVPWWAPTCNPHLIDSLRCVECGGTRTKPYATPYTPRTQRET